MSDKQARKTAALTMGLRAAGVALLLVFIHAATVLAHGHFRWAIFGYDEYGGLFHQIWYGAFGASVCAMAVIAIWIIFLLSDTSRLGRTRTRLASLRTGSCAGLAATDKVFAGLATGAAATIMLLYLAVAVR